MLEHLQALPPALILLVVAVLVMAEAALVIGVVLPGASAVVTLGILTSQTTVALAPAMTTVGAAAVLGTQLAYLAGRQRRASRFRPHDLSTAVGYLRAHLGPVVVGAQYVVGMRTLVPRLAGIAAVPYRRFAVFSIPASAVWGGAWVLLGHTVGHAYLTARIDLFAIVLVVLAAATLVIRRTTRDRLAHILEGSASVGESGHDPNPQRSIRCIGESNHRLTGPDSSEHGELISVQHPFATAAGGCHRGVHPQ